MQVIYKPKLNPDYSPIPGQEVAFALLIPDSYNPVNKHLFGIFVHGVGERSGGTLENIKNLVEGFDYNGDGIREGAPFVTADMKKAVDQYGIIMAIPTYESNTFFEPTKINYLYDYVLLKYNVYPKMLLTGFSYGGGATVKYATSTTANAGRLALAIPCAPTRNVVDASIPGKAGLAMHFFVNDKDDNGATNIDVTKGIVNDINRTATLKAQYTAFRKDGHGGNIEAWGLAPPVAPGGQGVINISENIYQWATDCIVNSPRQIKAGAITQPAPVPEPAPLPNAQAIVNYTVDGNKIRLSGEKSIGYTSGTQGKWELVSAPGGLKSWDVFPKGSTYIVADGVMSLPGTYVFRFILMNLSPVEVIVPYGDVVKVATGFDSSTDLITYSDGSTEKGQAILSSGKWTLKTAGGQVINL